MLLGLCSSGFVGQALLNRGYQVTLPDCLSLALLLAAHTQKSP